MKSNNKSIHSILLPLIFLIMLLPLTSAEGAMNDYCAIPPFLYQSIPPNVLIVLDNSGSMCDQAYAGSYDPSQFANGLYYGYFDGAKRYKYTSNGRWEVTEEPLTNGTVANPIATGSFLNWATMRRVEVAKKVLIGGKANPRSPSGALTVKLDGETGCSSLWNFDKGHDTSAGNLIYPFVGDYNFERRGGDLYVTPVSGGTSTFYTYPNSDISIPAGWSDSDGGPVTAWDKVDETPSDGDTTYIQNNNTTSPVIVGFTYTQPEPAGVITVRVQIRARKTASGVKREIIGVLRIDGVDYEANAQAIGTSYSLYTFTWATNPATSAPWTWDEIKGMAASGNLQGFGVKAAGNYTSKYPRVTQIYLDTSVSVPTGGPYKTIVDQGMIKAEGIIDTLTTDVRFGLAYYTYDNGARIEEYVGFGMATDMITSIHNMVPSTWTPLAESLYEMTRYYRQDAPYYSNSPADYSVGSGGGANIIRDPYWYKFTDLDSSLTDMYVPCAKSFVLFLTDGESTQDTNIPGTGSGACSLTNIKGCSVYGDLPDTRYAGTVVGTTYPSNGTDYMIDVAYWARTNDMRPGTCTDTPTSWQQCLPGNQNVITYPVFMFGRGSTLLKDVSIYGGFIDLNNNNKPDCIDIPAECYRDSNGDGTISADGSDEPITYYEGDDGYSLERSIKDAILAILKRAASGTAVSILASSEGQGANLLQAVFYPRKSVGDKEISWIGAMQNLWYYIDPLFQASTIREDTIQDKKLDLKTDYITQIYFDQTEGKTKASRCMDSNGDGSCDSQQSTVDLEDLKNLWEAGIKLFQKSPDQRRIFTNYNGLSLFNTSLAGDATFRGLLNAADATEATNIINYTRGTDVPNYRSRTVTLNIGGNNTTNTWKLGDIVHSTPRIQSWEPLNEYYERYKDQSYYKFINDLNEDGTPKASKIYTDRGMVYVGANDGMLHAFYLGKLKLYPGTTTLKAELQDLSSTYDPGDEVWSFIPNNALPYLKYLMDPNYCHLYYVDAPPYLFDASINTEGCTEANYWDCPKTNTWRTILIGSMNLGGACRNTNSTCTDCVKTPIANTGYSSYFALDITDQENPQLLWEFSDPTLGFSTSGPVVFRRGAPNKNGRWFVMFASGPTGPIDTTVYEFKGKSDQNLKLFILDLKTGQLLLPPIDTGITNAFGGSILNTVIDLNDDYQDDVLYIPYSKLVTGTWQGGILRFITDGIDQNNLSNPDFSNRLSTLISTSGPVTSAPAFLRSKSKHELWIYFGTGRYFYKTDDLTGRRRIYGIKDPCYLITDNINQNCTTTVSEGGLSDSTSSIPSSIGSGWYINLDCAPGDSGCTYTAPAGYSAERVITTPLALPAGAVFFTTFSPTSDICGYGGNSYVWAVNYKTGGVAPSAALQGKALLQLSTGEIKDIDLKTAFTERAVGGGGGRRTEQIFGLPPQGQGLFAIVPADPIKRFIFIREK